MGGEKSIIDTSHIQLQKIKANNIYQQNRFSPPFRNYTNQLVQLKGRKMIAIFDVTQPITQQITVNQQIYTDLQDAFNDRTKQITLQSVLLDTEYSDLRTYVARNNNKQVALQLKIFNSFNSHAFFDIMYQLKINQQIAKIKCKKLNHVIAKYIIQTGLQSQGQQNPNTQVFQLSPIATSLTQIIKYRRQNKWYWTVNQFYQLVYDLSEALLALHKNNITHNDIRPCNIYYSIQSRCYQLANFGNSIKYEQNKMKNMRKSMNSSTIRSSINYGAPQLSNNSQANLQQADIFSLGMTLLCAFYLYQPINLNNILEMNKKFEKEPIMGLLTQMIMPTQKRASMQVLIKRIPDFDKGQSKHMNNLVQSIKYKNRPQGQNLLNSKKMLSFGYQRLGLWNDWKILHHEANQLQGVAMDQYHKAQSLYELAKIQSCRGDIQAASVNAKQASTMYRQLGYKAYDQGNIHESLNLFSKATQCSKYFEYGNDLDTARNLQGLALIHAQKGQYQISKPLISESGLIAMKTMGKQSIDYCKIRMAQAKIQTDFGQFQSSDKILHQCLSIAVVKVRENEQLGMRLKAEVLHQIGRNAMMQSSYETGNQNALLSKAQRYLLQSMIINQKFKDNQAELINNIESFGQIQLRKQNYVSAMINFKKALQLRQIQRNNTNMYNTVIVNNDFDSKITSKRIIDQCKININNSQFKFKSNSKNTEAMDQRCIAQTICHIGACQSGMNNYQQALQYYNKALQIYKNIYGSDHNKFSAMTIGNMSKIYYKLNDYAKAKDCLRIATDVLYDLLGTDDPDYQHFHYLLQSM